MKTAIVALSSGLIGAIAILSFEALFFHDPQDVSTSGSLEPGDPSQDIDTMRSELDQVREELANLSQSLADIQAPVRTSAAPSVSAELTAVAERVDRLEQQVASLVNDVSPAERGANPAPTTRRGEQSTPSADLQRRLAATDKSNAPALVALADWAETQGLKSDAKRLLRMAIKADPQNATARARLGYTFSGGKWRTGTDTQRLQRDGR